MACHSRKQMAHTNNILLFVLFLSFHLLFSMSFTTNAASELINQVCSHTINYDFCVQTLTSDPGANNADLKGLEHISLRITTSIASENDAFIGKSLEKADPGVKQVLEHCRVNYENSMSALRRVASFLDGRGDYHEVDVNTHIALGSINDCDDVIKRGPAPPYLQDKNTKMLQLTDISKSIAGLLVSS